MRKLCLLLTAYCLLSSFSFSQSNQNTPLNREILFLYEKYLNSEECSIHASIKPFNNTKELEAISDSIRKAMKQKKWLSIDSSKSTVARNNISLSGLFTDMIGYEQMSNSNDEIRPEGEIGVYLQGRHGKKVSYNATIFSGSAVFPSYIDSFISYSNVVPGIGSGYSESGNYLFSRGFSYQYYSGCLSYSPNRIFNFQTGKDKHFWGDGYRSLFLSDVSNSYPFLKISATVWKLKYVNLFALMKDATASPFKNDFKNKYGTFHYLSWNATKRINVGFFESVIWQGTDSNRVRSYDVNYLNPVIFYRPAEYSLGSSDNAFLGASFKIKAGEKFHQQFYGQVILDEFLLSEIRAMNGWWANKQGIQLGFKSFDLFSLKNLSFQTEINAVRPYTYSHGSVQQNYGHYNQPLAHPLGANFTESVSFLNYRYKKWMFETEFLYAVYGKDENGKNYGGNIFESYTTRPMEYGNRFFQGLKTNLLYSKIKVAYYLIPSANLIAEAGMAVRHEKNSSSSLTSTFFFIGIKTGILNRYSDF